MSSYSSQVPWTDEQWARVNQAVQEEGARARVAATFLPQEGPLEPYEDFVRGQSLDDHFSPERTEDDFRPKGKEDDPEDDPLGRLRIDDITTIPLITLQIPVRLRSAQVQDPELKSAIEMFRRAASLLARAEDAIVFRGQAGKDEGPILGSWEGSDIFPSIARVQGGSISRGLFIDQRIVINKAHGLFPHPRPGPDPEWDDDNDLNAARAIWIKGLDGNLPSRLDLDKYLRYIRLIDDDNGSQKVLPPDFKGNRLVRAISDAIAGLERKSHYGPFAVVLGNELYTEAQSPNLASLVLPQDRILPFLAGGPLLRSSTLPRDRGVVIALGSRPAEIVVAKDMCVSFMQVSLDPMYVFRVHERIALRFRKPSAFAYLFDRGDARPDPGLDPDENGGGEKVIVVERVVGDVADEVVTDEVITDKVITDKVVTDKVVTDTNTATESKVATKKRDGRKKSKKKDTKAESARDRSSSGREANGPRGGRKTTQVHA